MLFVAGDAVGKHQLSKAIASEGFFNRSRKPSGPPSTSQEPRCSCPQKLLYGHVTASLLFHLLNGKDFPEIHQRSLVDNIILV